MDLTPYLTPWNAISRACMNSREGLKRHEADMPFWDDVKISALPDLAGRLLMVEATD